MSLTGYEQHVLAGIERQLIADDPGLDARLRGLAARSRPLVTSWLYGAGALSAVGLVLLIVGLVRSMLLVAEIGIGLMVVAPIILAVPAWRLRRH